MFGIMKIFSVDDICWINLECNGDPNSYSGFLFQVHVDIRHGQFDAKNIDVQFLNIENFVTDFDRFILDRSLVPRLEGTYDSYLTFSARGQSVMVRFSLGDAYCSSKTVYFHQTGEFEVAQENLTQYLADFHALVKPSPSFKRDALKRAP